MKYTQVKQNDLRLQGSENFPSKCNLPDTRCSSIHWNKYCQETAQARLFFTDKIHAAEHIDGFLGKLPNLCNDLNKEEKYFVRMAEL